MEMLYDAAGNADWLAMADAAIEEEDDICFDVAANVGQMFFNVSHMSWFRQAVAEELQDTLE